MTHMTNIRAGLAAVVLAAALTLIAAPSGLPASQQLLNLGPVVLANGTATLTGSVGSGGAGLNLAVNGQPVTVHSNGSFAANVTLNGEDVLSHITGDHSYVVQVPGTTTTITLAATDRQGVVQTQGRQLTVNAANANGIRVAKVRFSTKNVLRRHSLRMTVTTKDR